MNDAAILEMLARRATAGVFIGLAIAVGVGGFSHARATTRAANAGLATGTTR
jgi:hypothetical protein